MTDLSETETEIDCDTENELTESRYEQCPSCKQQFKRLTTHWARGNCGYPQIPSEVFDVCRGLLLAGSQFRERRKEPVIKTARSSKQLSDWLNECLGWLSNSIYSRNTRTGEAHAIQTKAHPGLWNLKKLADGTPANDDINPISLAIWRSIKGSDQKATNRHPRETRLPMGRASYSPKDITGIFKEKFSQVSVVDYNTDSQQRGRNCYLRLWYDEFESYVDQSYRYDAWRDSPSAPPQKRPTQSGDE